MSFAAARLSVSKDGPIIASEHILYQIVSSFGVYSLLVGILPKNIIERKWFYIILLIWFQYWYLIILFVYFYYARAPSLFLFLVHWADSHHNFDSFAHGTIYLDLWK